MARVLVVEDEADLRQVLEYSLRQAGHEPLMAPDGRTGLQLAREGRPDLVLLDLMLPDMPGTDVCKTLKREDATRNIPVLMLTARGEEIDRVVGFELGAEDYVTKPFSVRELLLRVGVILRRTAEPRDAGTLNEFGVLKIDRTAHRVFVNEEEARLTAMEFQLLTSLFDGRNRVQTRGVLLHNVWGIAAEIETRTVDTHVKRLREKLGPAGVYIETVRGVGYRFAEAPGQEAR